MLPTEGLDGESGRVEGVAWANSGYPIAQVAELISNARRRPDAQVRIRRRSGPKRFDVDVIAVLVGDEHGAGTSVYLCGLNRVEEDARVDDEGAIAVIESHA
jgi:hypothetical protein